MQGRPRRQPWRPGAAAAGLAAVVAERAAAWAQERRKLDLDLETAPLEARFSQQLTDHMAQEEHLASLALGEGEPGDRAWRALPAAAQRVDEVLAAETRRYFEAQAKLALQKWAGLLDRQAREAQQLGRDVDARCAAAAQLSAQPAGGGPGGADAPSTWAWPSGLSPTQARGGAVAFDAEPEVDVIAFAAEEARLRRETQLAWASAETFNLGSAFALQLARVDAEWGAYEARLGEERDGRLADLDGGAAADATARANDATAGRLKSKEAQGRLVHTAPVFEPDETAGAMPRIAGRGAPPPGAAAAPRPDAAQRAARRAQLAEGYAAAARRVACQKTNAKQWITRQALRMRIQIEATASAGVGDVVAPRDDAARRRLCTSFTQRRSPSSSRRCAPSRRARNASTRRRTSRPQKRPAAGGGRPTPICRRRSTRRRGSTRRGSTRPWAARWAPPQSRGGGRGLAWARAACRRR
ncbi:hypothetical protein M885DRAFT_549753 [Pelagophyceae sp. CCMP2097]|nr:hypothetical protein M885DRAFT_549753 [Pelagophyceae sp. CCMP2097]